MTVGVCMAAVDVPRPPAHVQGAPAWTGGKPSGRQSSPQPALSVSVPSMWHWPMCSSWCLGLWMGTQQLHNLSRQEYGGT